MQCIETKQSVLGSALAQAWALLSANQVGNVISSSKVSKRKKRKQK